MRSVFLRDFLPKRAVLKPFYATKERSEKKMKPSHMKDIYLRISNIAIEVWIPDTLSSRARLAERAHEQRYIAYKIEVRAF